MKKYTIPGYVTEEDILGIYNFDRTYSSDVSGRQAQVLQEKTWWADHKLLSRAEKFAAGAVAENLVSEKKALFTALADRVKKPSRRMRRRPRNRKMPIPQRFRRQTCGQRMPIRVAFAGERKPTAPGWKKQGARRVRTFFQGWQKLSQGWGTIRTAGSWRSIAGNGQ